MLKIVITYYTEYSDILIGTKPETEIRNTKPNCNTLHLSPLGALTVKGLTSAQTPNWSGGQRLLPEQRTLKGGSVTTGSCPALESGDTIGSLASGAAGCCTSVTCSGSWVLGKSGASHAWQFRGEVSLGNWMCKWSTCLFCMRPSAVST